MRIDRKTALAALLLGLAACSGGTGDDGADEASPAATAPSGQASVANDPAAGDVATIEQSADGAALYARCAACHTPDGSGVQGVFPPLQDNVVALASNTEGRAYLVSSLRYGLTGTIEVAGTSYSGMMPAQYPSLNEADIAAVLNHLLGANGGSADQFTLSEVQDILANMVSRDANSVAAMRPDV